MPIKCVIVLSSYTWIFLAKCTTVVFLLSREKMMAEPRTAISV